MTPHPVILRTPTSVAGGDSWNGSAPSSLSSRAKGCEAARSRGIWMGGRPISAQYSASPPPRLVPSEMPACPCRVEGSLHLSPFGLLGRDDRNSHHVVAGGFIPPEDRVCAGINPAPTFGEGNPVTRCVAAGEPGVAVLTMTVVVSPSSTRSQTMTDPRGPGQPRATSTQARRLRRAVGEPHRRSRSGACSVWRLRLGRFGV